MSLVERSSLPQRFVFFHPNTCLFPIYNELFTVGVSNDNSQLCNSGVATPQNVHTADLGYLGFQDYLKKFAAR